MKTKDSRRPIGRPTSTTVMLPGGKPACVSCWKRPKRWSGNRWQSYCKECHAEYTRLRRQGRIEMLLTYDEARVIQDLRARPAVPRGRHAAAVAAVA